MSRLSVIIPGYNTPDTWWNRCLKSVCAACGPDDEIICVDDGSRQRPKVSVADARIRWIYLEKNSGQSAARNRALVEAQGEYVTFVDSDDEVMPRTYERISRRLERTKADVVVFGVRTVWVNERLFKDNVCSDEYCDRLSHGRAEDMYRNCLLEYSWNKLYRREMLVSHRIRFPEGLCPGEDTIFNLLVFRTNPIVMTISGIGYLYYRYDGSSLSRYLPTNLEAMRYRANLWNATFDFANEECTESENIKSEWDNIWRRNSPTGFCARFAFAKRHGFSFFRKLVQTFFRKYMYIRIVRRWRVKRMYPYAQEWKETL